MKRKFTDEQEKQICEDYFSEEKPSLKTLAKRWGCSHTLIGDAIIRNGYTLRARGEHCKGKTPWNKGIVYPKEINRKTGIFTKEQEQQICSEYFSEEKPSTKTLAKKWGCCDLTICNIIKRNGYKVRTKSEAHIGKKVWITGLTKETNESVKQMSESLSKFSRKQEQQICKEYIKDKLNTFELAKKWNCNPETIGNIVRRNGFVLRTHSEAMKDPKIRKRISISRKGHKAWNKNIPHSDNTKEKISKKASTPERIQQSLKNGHGKKCYYNNEFFPSLMERNCYIKLKKLGFKVEHNFEKRFDFLVLTNTKKVVVEFHPFDFNLTDEQYYRNRRKLLDEYGYKNLKLIVIKDLKEIENKLGNEI